MKKIWLIASREFTATVGTRGFIIGILMVPLMLAFFGTVAPRLMNQRGPRVSGEVALVDSTGLVGAKLRKAIAPESLAARRLATVQGAVNQAPGAVRQLGQKSLQGPALSKLLGEVPAITLVEMERTADLQQAKEWLRQPDARAPRRLGVIVMHADAVIRTGEHGAYGTYDFFKPSTLDERTEGTIKESVREAVVGARLSYEKLDQHDIDAIVRLEPPDTRVLTPQGKDEVAHPVLNRTIPLLLLVFLIMGTYTGAGSLLSTTVEEKFNRVMEVLLSAVSPFELMVGKILGQLAVSGLVMALYVSLGVLVLSSFALLGLVEPSLLLYLLIFFLTTYLIVGALMGAVGAAVNDLRDAQNLLLPINLVMMLPWLLAFPISSNPDSTLSVVMSFVPPLNGFAMLLRLASSSPPPAWQVILSILISLASALVALWFASKIFRIALLFHGKPPNLATFIRWARAA